MDGAAKNQGQAGTLIMLLSNVTEPADCASALPFSVAPVARVMEPLPVMMVPLKVELVPSVAELPTCQKILWALAVPASATLLPLKVVSPVAIWKIQTGFTAAPPSRVTVPVIPKVELDL